MEKWRHHSLEISFSLLNFRSCKNDTSERTVLAGTLRWLGKGTSNGGLEVVCYSGTWDPSCLCAVKFVRGFWNKVQNPPSSHRAYVQTFHNWWDSISKTGNERRMLKQCFYRQTVYIRKNMALTRQCDFKATCSHSWIPVSGICLDCWWDTGNCIARRVGELSPKYMPKSR